MKRRDFVAMLGSASLLSMAGSSSSMANSQSAGALVDTPQKRLEYTQKLLKKLCTDIGPHPTGTPAFHKAAQIIKKEMELSLPSVEYDRFPVDLWELLRKAQFILGGQDIETFPTFGGEGTPSEGISGILTKSGGSFSLVDPSTGKVKAQISISSYGKAITHNQGRTNPPSVPSFGVGKQDVPLLERAVKYKTPAMMKARVKYTRNAQGENIIGRLPGKRTDEILVVAHADTVYNAPGANDNTASVIVMLMMAHAAAGRGSDHTLTFVASDAEEFGMLGAKHYGERRLADGTMKNIRFVANFDSLTYGPNLWISSKNDDIKDIIRSIHSDLHIDTTPKYDDSDGFVMDSDPFRPSGAKAFHANSRGYDEKTLPVYHRPDDNAESVPLDCVETSFLVFDEFMKRVDKM
jgi:hypothetical protein